MCAWCASVRIKVASTENKIDSGNRSTDCKMSFPPFSKFWIQSWIKIVKISRDRTRFRCFYRFIRRWSCLAPFDTQSCTMAGISSHALHISWFSWGTATLLLVSLSAETTLESGRLFEHGLYLDQNPKWNDGLLDCLDLECECKIHSFHWGECQSQHRK